MKELTLEEKKEIGLCILKYFDNICTANNIRYFVAYGTLIGAVRHGGFIPWDDDLDVWVPIDDYFRLLDLLKKEAKYEVIDMRNSLTNPWSFSKLSDKNTVVIGINQKDDSNDAARGVSLDIFPLFDCEVSKLWYLHLKIIQKAISFSYVQHSNKLITLFRRKLVSLITKEKNTGVKGFPLSLYGYKDIHDYSCFADVLYLKFEDMRISAPIGYDRILREIYGNYMDLPPENKRNSGHNVKVYYKKDFYKNIGET